MTSLGLIEGFYGRPWSWDARLRMADRLGSLGFELFVHAPKEDGVHRLLWREPYLPEDLARFEELATRCRAGGVELVVGLSPLAARFADGEDTALVVDKLASLGQRGVRSFAILFDDMPPEFAHASDATRFVSLAHAHVAMANAVLDALRARTPVDRFLFCPLLYSGDGDSPYLRALGEGLAPEVEVFWTGPEVCSETISAADLAAVAAALRRPPLIWDNYPVNDGWMAGDLRLGPTRGRAADLPGAVRGLVANGALQPEATAIALHSLRLWANDPAGYDPDAAWPAALAALVDAPEDVAGLAVLGDLTRRSPVDRTTPTRFGRFATEFWRDWEEGRRSSAIGAARAELATLGTALQQLERVANRWLAEEIAPWVERLAAWRDAFAVAIEGLQAPAPGRRRATLAALERAQGGASRVDDWSFEGWIRRSLRTAVHD